MDEREQQFLDGDLDVLQLHLAEIKTQLKKGRIMLLNPTASQTQYYFCGAFMKGNKAELVQKLIKLRAVVGAAEATRARLS